MDVMNILKNIQKQLEEQRTENKENLKKVTEQVTQNVSKIMQETFVMWEEKYKKLEEIVENQEKRIYFLEKEARKRNVVLFGIEEIESSYEDLQTNVTRWVEKYFSINLAYSDIQEVKRIGKKNERPRPVVIRFSTLGTKIKLFKQKSALNNSKYYIKEDYPHYILEKRRELQEQLKIEREKGNIASIRYDKLIIHNNNNKRTLSLSPEAHISQPNKKQTNKKNKTQLSHFSSPRTSSLSEEVIKPSMLNFLINKNTEHTSKKYGNKDSKK